MPCSFCKRDLEPVSGGLCNACYQRKRKRGSPDYAPVRVRGKCTLRGCDRPHAARGMCYMHWERCKATGNPQETKRPDSWGANTKHPLYGSWDHMRRKRHITPIAPQWDDFLQFAHDVGARPEPGAKLFVANDTQPIGPGTTRKQSSKRPTASRASRCWICRKRRAICARYACARKRTLASTG
jgi:hypothetical protein